jgi:hypothetical protein
MIIYMGKYSIKAVEDLLLTLEKKEECIGYLVTLKDMGPSPPKCNRDGLEKTDLRFIR